MTPWPGVAADDPPLLKGHIRCPPPFFFSNLPTFGVEILSRAGLMTQARSQEFPERGSSTSIANRAHRGRGSRPPETLGYLEQNPAI